MSLLIKINFGSVRKFLFLCIKMFKCRSLLCTTYISYFMYIFTYVLTRSTLSARILGSIYFSFSDLLPDVFVYTHGETFLLPCQLRTGNTSLGCIT